MTEPLAELPTLKLQAMESRQRLKVELRRLRNAANYTQREVAVAMEWSPSKMIRIESGNVGVRAGDLRALLAYYEVVDPARIEELQGLARNSRTLPFEQYQQYFSDGAVRYFQCERSAKIIREFEPLVVPGLLQLEPYTRALQSESNTDEDQVDRIISSRQDRQEVLTRDDPPPARGIFLIDESTFWRRVGSEDVMVRQLNHLMEMNERPNIEIRVIPQDVGAYAGFRGPFSHLEFSEDQVGMSDIVYVEGPIRDEIHQGDPEVIGMCLNRFAAIEAKALRKSELPEFITNLINSTWGWTRNLPRA